MTKRGFVNAIAAATGYPKTHIDSVIGHFLEQLTVALEQGGRVELRNFGVFRTVELPARVGRNPRTGAPVNIEASRHARFRAGKRMRETLNP